MFPFHHSSDGILKHFQNFCSLFSLRAPDVTSKLELFLSKYIILPFYGSHCVLIFLKLFCACSACYYCASAHAHRNTYCIWIYLCVCACVCSHLSVHLCRCVCQCSVITSRAEMSSSCTQLPVREPYTMRQQTNKIKNIKTATDRNGMQHTWTT